VLLDSSIYSTGVRNVESLAVKSHNLVTLVGKNFS